MTSPAESEVIAPPSPNWCAEALRMLLPSAFSVYVMMFPCRVPGLRPCLRPELSCARILRACSLDCFGPLERAAGACRYSSGVSCFNGRYFVYGAYNYVVVVAADTRRVLAVLLGHGNKVTAVATSPSTALAVAISGSKDRSVVAWSLDTLSVLRKRSKLPAEVAATCVLPAATVALALASGLVCSWVWSPGAPPYDSWLAPCFEHALAPRRMRLQRKQSKRVRSRAV